MSKTPLSIQGITAVALAVVAYGKKKVVLVAARWPLDYAGERLGCVEP